MIKNCLNCNHCEEKYKTTYKRMGGYIPPMPIHTLTGYKCLLFPKFDIEDGLGICGEWEGEPPNYKYKGRKA